MANKNTTFILDTSVLLSAGKQALTAFKGHSIVLPLVVVKELEKKRTDPIIGFVARSVLRKIEDLRIEHGNDLHAGIVLDEQGSTFRIEVNHVDRSSLPDSIKREGGNDAMILAVALNLKQDGAAKAGKVVLVTNDLPMRILAVSVGIDAQEYRVNGLSQGEYKGVFHADVEWAEGEDIIGSTPSDDVLLSYDDVTFREEVRGRNIGVILHCGTSAALCVGDGKYLYKINGARQAMGASGRSAEQRIALHHLLDEDRPVVSLGGQAGTGKTLLALAAGLEQVMEQRRYSKVIVFRPLLAVGGQSLGFLPGTEAEKMDPWAAAVFDALEAVVNKGVIEAVKKGGLLEVLPITHIRGRTFHDAFVIVDEAQNLDRTSLLSVLSRVGQQSKVVMSWDAAQKDNLNIAKNDGVVAVVDRLKEEEAFAHVTLMKSERSRVAEMASRLLEEMSS